MRLHTFSGSGDPSLFLTLSRVFKSSSFLSSVQVRAARVQQPLFSPSLFPPFSLPHAPRVPFRERDVTSGPVVKPPPNSLSQVRLGSCVTLHYLEPTVTLVHIPEGHVGCCERVKISELLKFLQNAGESATPCNLSSFRSLLNAPARNQATPRPPAQPQPYRRREKSKVHTRRSTQQRGATGKGKGCISTGPIPRGALIIRERPLIIAPTVMTFPRNFDHTVARAMPPNERALLSNCYEDKVIGIL